MKRERERMKRVRERERKSVAIFALYQKDALLREPNDGRKTPDSLTLSASVIRKINPFFSTD